MGDGHGTFGFDSTDYYLLLYLLSRENETLRLRDLQVATLNINVEIVEFCDLCAIIKKYEVQ